MDSGTEFDILHLVLKLNVSWNGAVGIATRDWVDGQENESQWGRDFPHLSNPALRPALPPVKWVLALFTGGKAAGAWR
jgi:hypothetical protein